MTTAIAVLTLAMMMVLLQDNSDNSNSSTDASNYGGASNSTAYSPSEEDNNGRTWGDFFKGKAKPTHKPMDPMSPRQGAFETRRVDQALDTKIDKACQKAVQKLVKAKNEQELDQAIGEVRMCKKVDSYRQTASHRKMEIADAVYYGREAPKNLNEAYGNLLHVASDRAGEHLGDAAARGAHHVAKKGFGDMADLMFTPAPAPAAPAPAPTPALAMSDDPCPSPRAYDDIN